MWRKAVLKIKFELTSNSDKIYDAVEMFVKGGAITQV